MKSRRNIILCSGFLVIGLSTAYSSMFGTAYSWLGGNGNWNDATKWNPNGIPDAVGEEAQIGAAGTYTVTMNISPNIDTASITNAGTTLNMGAGSLTLNAAAGFSNAGTISTGGSNAINLLSGSASGTNTATGVISVNQNTSLTLKGNLWQNNGSIQVNPQQVGNPTTLSFDGAVSLSGTGAIQLSHPSGATVATVGSSVLTQGASHKIQGRGIIQAALTNSGSVVANWNGQPLTLNTNNKTNNGVFSAAGGGFMSINGITVTQGPTAQLFADGGEIYINGATIVGGILSRSGTSNVRNQTGTTGRITGTTITGSVFVEQNSTLNLAGAQTTNNGSITVNPEQVGNPTRLNLQQSHTLTGTGIVSMNAAGVAAEISGDVGATLTNAASHTIAGRGTLSVPFANAGTVNASWNGQTLNVTGGTKTNTALMTATSGGTMALNFTTLQQSGAGQLFANGGTVTVANSTLTGGTLNTTNGAIYNTNTSTYSNLTNNGDFRLSQNTSANMLGTITNNGTITINFDQIGNPTIINATSALTFAGTGIIAMSAAGVGAQITSNPGISITNNAGHTIAGRGRILAGLINNGTVNASWGGQTLEISGDAKQNSNLMTAVSTGNLQLTGTTVTQVGSGRMLANGGYIQHSGSSKVIGGKLQSAGGTFHYVFNGPATLENVTNEGDFRINQNNQLNLSGSTLTNTGTINVNIDQIGNPSGIQLKNSLGINGSGLIQLSSPGIGAEISGANTGVVLTHGAGHTIAGRGRVSVKTTNNGTINANWGGQTLELTASDVTNNSVMKAEATGTLNIASSVVTQGVNGTIQPVSGNIVLTGSTSVSGGKFLASPVSHYVYMQSGTPSIGNLTNEAEIRIPQNNTGRISGDVVNTGSIQLNNEQIGNVTQLQVVENATLSGGGLVQLRSPGVGSEISVSTNKTLTLGAGQTVQGRGRISGQVVNQGNVRANWGGQTLELVPSQTGISNEGLIRVESTATLSVSDGSKFVNKGDFIIDPAHTATFTSGDFKQTAGAATVNGTLDLAPGAKLEADGGIVKGGGVLDGSLQNDAGDVQPGASAGKLRVQGTFSQAAAGKTTIEIGGATQVSQYDLLEVTGAATLGGTLKIKLINNYTPASGTTFTVLTGSSVTGTFSNIEFEGTSDSEPSVLYTSNAVIVTFLTKVNPTSVVTIDGIPFGGNLNSLFSSDDDWYSTLCDEENVNGKVEITTTSPVATLSNLRFAFETGATRSDLTERIEMFNYVTNSWVTVGPLISTNLGDRRRVVVQATNMSQFVRAGDRQMKVRVSWVPQTDLEISDGWGINIDQAAWFISE